jgi:DNA-binding Lrp family transcriptional regulator
MLSAYLFVNLNQEFSGEDIITDVVQIDQVKFAYRLYGMYDLCIYMEADTTVELKEVTLESIRKLRFVESTVTFISLESYIKNY